MKILMVCLGNICRSPLAEAILREKARIKGLNWIIDSAGTNSYHTGEPPHTFSQKIARLNGIDISNQRARTFTKNDFLKYDKIFAMASDVLYDIKKISGKDFDINKAELFLNALDPSVERDVPDPWYGPEEGYHQVYELINKACDAIINDVLTKTKSTH